MENWDKFNLSWNQQEVLGCLLPNQEQDTLLINAKLVLRPEKHWNSVHAPKKNPQKGAMQRSLTNMFPKKKKEDEVIVVEEPNSKSSTQSSTSIDSASSPEPSSSSLTSSSKSTTSLGSPKLTQKKKFTQPTVGAYLDPKINFKGHQPRTRLEKYSLGSALNTVHVGVNACISDNNIVKVHQSESDKLRQYYTLFVKEPMGNFDKKKSLELCPPKVSLNAHNIHDGISSIVNAYRRLNQSASNPYRLLENTENYSLIHDATTYFVKQLNASILRVLKDDGTVVKVPFNLKRVSGSLTGEVFVKN